VPVSGQRDGVGLVHRERVFLLWWFFTGGKLALFPVGIYWGSFWWDIQCPTSPFSEKLTNNSSRPLSHNIGYMLFTPYSPSPGILLCEANARTHYVSQSFLLDILLNPPSPDPSPTRVNVGELNWSRLAALLTPRPLSISFLYGSHNGS